MADHLSLTQKWLRQNIQLYSRRDIVYNHVDALLAAHQTLRPKTDVYTFDDGRSQLLLCVHGLLPISYRRASYNIPIAVWLTLEYPTRPPVVYVVPTSDMLVKAGKYVDVSGQCEPAYIQAWQKKSEGCNLKALIEALSDQFSREPPVYAKPQQPSPPPRPREGPSSAPRTPDYSNRPPPPTSPGPPQSNDVANSLSPGGRPTPPPRPVPPLDSSNRPPTNSPPPQVLRYSHVPGQTIYHPPRSATSSTFEPPTYSAPPIHTQTPPHPHNRSSSAHLSSSPVPGPSHFYTPPEPIPPQQQRWSMPPGTLPAHHTGPQQRSVSLHQPTPMQVQSPVPPPPPPPHTVVQPVPPNPTRNFLDEDEDDNQPEVVPPTNAPPRPPNPEVLHLHAQIHAKFNSELAALDQTLSADSQRLRAAQSDLLAGEPAIRDEMARLEAVRDVCRVVASRLRTTVDTAEMNLAELRRKGDPEVDELICSTTIVYNQLVNLVAEDNAIEDTIYHLHRALNAGRIDLDKFLRSTRALAEEQFMKRALAEKIVASIPMGAWT